MTTRPRQHIIPLLQGDRHDERRRHGRIRCTALTTRFGNILDMSASGMRVQCNGLHSPKLNEVLDVEIHHPHGILTITTKIVWRECIESDHYITAFRFMDLSPQKQHELLEVIQESLHAAAMMQTPSDSSSQTEEEENLQQTANTPQPLPSA